VNQQASEGVGVLTSAVTAAALANGRPPEDVIIWSILGALVAVWLNRNQGAEFNFKWLLSIFGTVFVSVMCGIVGSAVLMAVTPEYSMLRPFSKMPQWTGAFIIAALIHTIAPLAYAFATRWLNKKEPKDVANNP